MRSWRAVFRFAALLGASLAVDPGSDGAAEAQGFPVFGVTPLQREGTASPPAAAEHHGTAGEDVDRHWKGEVEAGVINTTGNSRNQSLRARMKLQLRTGNWRYGLTGDFLQVQEGGTTTTEYFSAMIKADRTLNEANYLFSLARYESDRFAGYRPRVAEAAGYGRRFSFSDRIRIDTEIGVGGRHTWYTDGTRTSEGIVRLAFALRWKVGGSSELSEEVFSEFGEHDVYTESQTSLKTKINARFALKANVTVKHDTVVPDERYKTDTITSLTPVYDL